MKHLPISNTSKFLEDTVEPINTSDDGQSENDAIIGVMSTIIFIIIAGIVAFYFYKSKRIKNGSHESEDRDQNRTNAVEIEIDGGIVN